jgi:hypothetical protein
LSAGGGSPPPNNIAQVTLSNAPTFNSGNGWSWIPATADMSIFAQSGSDLSVVDNGSDQANLVSAAGGWFQFGCYFGSPAGVTLDAGSATARWLTLAASIGVNGAAPEFHGFGIDLYAPVDDSSNGSPVLTVASVPALVLPGGPVLANISFQVVNAFGTDVITQPLSGFSDFAVWQIPALT